MRLVDDLPRRPHPSIWQHLFLQTFQDVGNESSSGREASPEPPVWTSPDAAERHRPVVSSHESWTCNLRHPPKQQPPPEPLPALHAEALRALARDLGTILADRFLAEIDKEPEKGHE